MVFLELSKFHRLNESLFFLAFILTSNIGSFILVDCVPVHKNALQLNPIYGKYFQGDMRFSDGLDPRNGIIGDRYRWPRNTVPYVISNKFTNSEMELIRGALAEISNKTCIKFIERAEPDHVFIERENTGCWSYVGRQGGRQILNLQPPPGPHCIWHGTVAHEMIHAIGFYHEQSRTDRDDYVTIVWNNIPPELQYNFDKYSSSIIDPQGVPYDYASLMHYGAYAFAIDPTKPTIVPKIDVEIGQTEGLSDGDAKKVRAMYNCINF